MLVAFLMGFCAGLPYLLPFRTLQVWMTEEGVSLKVLGIFSILGLPYCLKFLWSPFLDHIHFRKNRRKFWLFISQIALTFLIAAIGFVNVKNGIYTLALFSFLICFFSATQDIVIDAYRRETLEDNELGLGSALYIYGYRLGLFIAGAGAIFLADQMPWKYVYFIMAGLMFCCLFVTGWADEPEIKVSSELRFFKMLSSPFLDFFKRKSVFYIIAFILLYKLGDSVAGAMAMPFYLKIGFTKTQIAAFAKTLGLFSTFLGLLLGGIIILKKGIKMSLFLFGILQAVSTLGFSFLSLMGPFVPGLATMIFFEDLSAGMGTAALVAYMGMMANKQFSATQYALMTSVMCFSARLIPGMSGYMAESLNWFLFFLVCAIMAIPGLYLITRIPTQISQR